MDKTEVISILKKTKRNTDEVLGGYSHTFVEDIAIRQLHYATTHALEVFQNNSENGEGRKKL